MLFVPSKHTLKHDSARRVNVVHAAWMAFAGKVACVIETVVPSGPAKVSTWESSWCASALTIPVPSPDLPCAKPPAGLPIPVSEIESFQFVPLVS